MGVGEVSCKTTFQRGQAMEILEIMCKDICKKICGIILLQTLQSLILCGAPHLQQNLQHHPFAKKIHCRDGGVSWGLGTQLENRIRDRITPTYVAGISQTHLPLMVSFCIFFLYTHSYLYRGLFAETMFSYTYLVTYYIVLTLWISHHPHTNKSSSSFLLLLLCPGVITATRLNFGV